MRKAEKQAVTQRASARPGFQRRKRAILVRRVRIKRARAGVAMRDEVAAAYARVGREAEVVDFLDDMEKRFAEADLVCSRSGGGSSWRSSMLAVPMLTRRIARTLRVSERAEACRPAGSAT